MVTIEVSIEDISKLMGYDKPLSPDELDDQIAYAISEVDSEPDGPDENGHTKITIDIKTSNRPDLWSAEGIARVILGSKGTPGLPSLDAPESGFEINVTEELVDIRPYIGAAVIRGLDFDDFLIKQMIQLQDKVDFSFGRKRKRTSIGIYNINMIESPIAYTVVDRSFKFQPLGMDEELNINEIFEQHPKGIEFKGILRKFEKVPMLVGAEGGVLSMPPIINSNDVGRVTTDTTDVLVEVTGTNYGATIQALAVVVQALRDRGGEVSSVKINYPDNYDIKEDITPHSNPLEIEVDPKDINRYLGTNFSTKKIIELIRIRRNDAKKKGSKILVLLPPWRRDVLHWVDVSEDVAIAYGYKNFEVTNAQVVTSGKLSPATEDENVIRKILTGLGLIEVMNYTLINIEDMGVKVNRDAAWVKKNVLEISNPVSSNYNYVRSELLPALLRFISANTHNEYPQRVFETGECVVVRKKEVITKINAVVVLAGFDETFETIQGVLDSLINLLGLEYSLQHLESNYYLKGRGAEIMIDGIIVGHIGEIHPQIINNYGVEVPMSALELDLSRIKSLNIIELSSNKNQ